LAILGADFLEKKRFEGGSSPLFREDEQFMGNEVVGVVLINF